jgi:hypothetical protein
MKRFIEFIEHKSEERKNLDAVISKLPDNHQKLLKHFDITYTCKNTLNGDDEHIGMIHKFDVEVAAPWRYSREFTTLHEIAHLVWEKIVSNEDKKDWSKLAKLYKGEPKMNDEELFCMVYAAAYSTHPPATYNIEKLTKFVKKF